MAWNEYPEQLPATEQARLFALMSNGTPREAAAARDALIATNLRLVEAVVAQYRNGSAETDDVFQAGVEGLIEAVDRHTAARGPFAAFATVKIRQAIGRELRSAGFAVFVPRARASEYHRINTTVGDLMTEMSRSDAIAAAAVQHDVPVSTVRSALNARAASVESLDVTEMGATMEVQPDADVVASMTTGALYAAVRSLPTREAAIIAARVGLNGTTPMPLRDIADALGVTEGEASALENRAFARLRHPSRAATIGA